MPKFNLGWLKDKNGAKFAPKTFLSQILNNDGSLFQDRVKNIEDNISNMGWQFDDIIETLASCEELSFDTLTLPDGSLLADENNNILIF